LHEVIQPGGHIILTTPYHGYLKNLLISLLGMWDRHSHGGLGRRAYQVLFRAEPLQAVTLLWLRGYRFPECGPHPFAMEVYGLQGKARMIRIESQKKSISSIRSTMVDLTAIILTFNEEMHIERCIRSVQEVVERVLCD